MSRRNTKIWIGNLPRDIHRDELRDKFEKYGNVRGVEVKYDYAFLEYDHYKDAEDAVYQLDGRHMFGGRVKVELAIGRSKEPREDPIEYEDLRPGMSAIIVEEPVTGLTNAEKATGRTDVIPANNSVTLRRIVPTDHDLLAEEEVPDPGLPTDGEEDQEAEVTARDTPVDRDLPDTIATDQEEALRVVEARVAEEVVLLEVRARATVTREVTAVTEKTEALAEVILLAKVKADIRVEAKAPKKRDLQERKFVKKK
eukprot:CAMPEP_0115019758 /NCGR_PEP_ID=MMETSP0216-20121206/29651_1 /TAXON_ID=223996 /ORGANISM="Protocruzia adherens, Strain Boccale" /LENGTH=254 /DNA_ID=CAMNT_0002391323 /DNA_START=116 /DNA_END=881 /DNA_ORIENTATION=-